MLSLLSAVGRATLDLVLPFRCAACGEIVEDMPGFCPACFQQLRFITAPLCVQCGAPFEVPVSASTRCGACLASPPPWSAARAIWHYEGSARLPILRLKYGDRTDLVTLFVRHLVSACAELSTPDSLLVPVPLHRWRLLRRTFNQSALLVQALAKATRLPHSLTGLQRVKPTRPQQGLTRSQRQQNVQAAFRVAPTSRPLIQGKTIILVDDVLTTGATVTAAAKVLLRAGAADIKVLTLARVVNSSVHTI
jgi:ComF family protein